MLIPFDDPKWCEALREALTNYAEKRRDPAAYVETLYGSVKPQAKARHVERAADEAATARALLAQLPARGRYGRFLLSCLSSDETLADPVTLIQRLCAEPEPALRGRVADLWKELCGTDPQAATHRAS